MMTRPCAIALPEGADVEQVQPVAEHADDERADQRADDAALAAEEVGAADHDRSDGAQLLALRHQRVRRVEPPRHDEPGDRRHQAGEGVGVDLGAPDVDAGDARRLAVAADGVDRAAERRVAQDVPADDAEEQRRRPRSPGCRRDGRCPSRSDRVGKGRAAGCRLERGHRQAVGHEQRDAAKDRHRAERGDEVRDLEADDDPAVERAARRRRPASADARCRGRDAAGRSSDPAISSGCVSSTVPTEAESAAMAATERSMPPVRITNVWPMARIAVNDDCRATFRRLLPVRKYGVAKERKTTSSDERDQRPAAEQELLKTAPTARAPSVRRAPCASLLLGSLVGHARSLLKLAWRSSSSWVSSSRGELGGDPPVAHDEHAVGHADQLLDLRRDHQDRGAARDEPAHQREHLRLGADVDAARRLVEDEDARAARQPAREDDLLLVAAAEEQDLARQRGGRMLSSST